MKKMITIYLIGVVLCFLMTWNTFTSMNYKYHSKMTYGDIAAATIISLTSWIGLTAIALYEVTHLDLWDKPI